MRYKNVVNYPIISYEYGLFMEGEARAVPFPRGAVRAP